MVTVVRDGEEVTQGDGDTALIDRRSASTNGCEDDLTVRATAGAYPNGHSISWELHTVAGPIHHTHLNGAVALEERKTRSGLTLGLERPRRGA